MATFTDRFEIRVTPEQRRALAELAAERAQTPSTVVRELVLREARHARPRNATEEITADRAGRREELSATA